MFGNAAIKLLKQRVYCNGNLCSITGRCLNVSNRVYATHKKWRKR